MFAAFLQTARPCTSHGWCCVPSFNGATLHCRGPAEEGRPRPGQAQRATGESAAVFLSLKGYKQWPQSKRSRPDPGWVTLRNAHAQQLLCSARQADHSQNLFRQILVYWGMTSIGNFWNVTEWIMKLIVLHFVKPTTLTAQYIVKIIP